MTNNELRQEIAKRIDVFMVEQGYKAEEVRTFARNFMFEVLGLNND